MTEAYLIEDGKITEPIREGNLIGNGPEVLASIDAVGDDFAMGSPGTCGKDGQGVPVGDGIPTMRVPALTIGGHGLDGIDRQRPSCSTSPPASPSAPAPGEQIEAYVARSTSTSVRAYDGEVESLTPGRARPGWASG